MMNKNEWKKVKLEECANINMGQSPISSSYNINGDGIPFYQGNADFGELYPKLRYFCNKPIKIANEKDLLLSVRAPIGKINIAKTSCCIGRGLCAITPKRDIILQKYLYYILKYKEDEFNSKGTGSTFKAINKKQILETMLLLPNIDIQKNIILKLENCEKLLKLKKEQFLNLEKLVKFQFLKMFGMGSNDMKHIGDIANICRGASPRPISKYVTNENDGVNWIKIGDVSEKDIYITHTSEKITKDGAKKSRAVEPGDFILSNSMSFGRPYLVGINGCVHDGWLIISGYQEYLDPLFFYYELRSDLVQRQFNGSANGSCVKNLNSDLVKKVKIYVPPKEQQILFADFVKKVDKSKVIFEKTLKILDFGLNYFNVL